MSFITRPLLPLLAAAALVSAPQLAEARKVVVKVGTLAPEGSAWHLALQKVGQRWKEASKGDVQLKIYPGGVAGDEGDMIRKMRIGQLHMGSVTGIGLGQITRATMALQVPMMIRSWDELDHVRARMSPKIEAEMDAQGFVVLNWGDAGWVHQFSVKPEAKTADDYRKLKYMVWNEDPDSEKAWRSAGFQPVPLSSTDVLSGLSNGMIEAFGTAPLFALSSQWFGVAKHMVAVNWAPLNGATIIAKDTWEKIDPSLRPQLLAIAREEGEALKTTVRKLNDDAVKAMVDRGLTVHAPSAAEVDGWVKAAELAYPQIRGKVIPGPIFDEVKKLAEDFRAGKK